MFRESPRWNKRIAARALFRTAREIALGMQHLHSSNILHGEGWVHGAGTRLTAQEGCYDAMAGGGRSYALIRVLGCA